MGFTSVNETRLHRATWREGGQYIAHAMPLDVASSGPTPAKARGTPLLTAVNPVFVRAGRPAKEAGTLEQVLAKAI